MKILAFCRGLRKEINTNRLVKKLLNQQNNWQK